MIFVETFALISGTIFALFAFSILKEVGGHELSLEPFNANFLEHDDYEGPVTDTFSVRHDCNHVLQANLDIFLRPNHQPHDLHQPLTWGHALWRLNPWSGQVPAGDIAVELKFHNFDESIECNLLAVHVPGEIEGFAYLVHKENHAEWIEAEAITSPSNSLTAVSDLAAGAKILLPLDKYPTFERVGFVWKNALVHLGDYDVGVKIRSGFLQNLEPSASGSVATFLTKIHTPRGYRIKSASYREDREPQLFSHASGPVYIYRFAGLFDGTPLAVRFTKRVGESDRESRLILWSALLGLGIGIMIEALFSLLRTFALPRETDAN